MPSSTPPTSRFNDLAPQAASAVLDLPNRRNSLISFDYIAETGTAPTGNWADNLFGNRDLRVNLDADDAYTRALEQMIRHGMQKMYANPDISSLLAKQVWNKDDRVQWESRLAQTLADEMKAIPSLDSYRTTTPAARPAHQTYDVERAPLLNQLAQDITSGTTPRHEFDCEQMSLTLGLAIHFTEQKMLPPAETPDNLRAAQRYYYTVGNAHSLPPENGEMAAEVKNNPINGHALLVSGATGNFIEATNNNADRFNPGYKAITTPGYDFQTFLRTGIAVLDHRTVLADTADMPRARAAAAQDGLIAWCVRKIEDYGQEPPSACQTPTIQSVLDRRKPAAPGS